MKNEKLSKEEQTRYSRHLALPEVGIGGQEKLKKAKVLIVGAGGLGSPAAMYLAAAGVGTIGIVDYDNVELSNLQRQVLYSIEDIGKPKVAIIKKQLEKINPNIKVIAYNQKLTSENALETIKNYDVVIDGSDNLPAKYLANDACVFLKKPMVYGAVFKFDGQISVFNHNNGPCYRCLFPNPPHNDSIPNCRDSGVLGVLPGAIGTMQATEALKIIINSGNILSGRLLAYNALGMDFKQLNFGKNKNCAVCSGNAQIKELADYEGVCNDKNGIIKHEITAKELKKMIDAKEDFVLVDTREKVEQDICKIETAKLASFSEIASGNMKAFDNISKDKKIVLYCHRGKRGAYALNILGRKGYKNVSNLVGGIDAWANQIDREMPVY